ncbi:unnamed protein product [Nyctereutes procyonoides]|uniref:Cytochrome c oxidase assembly factor 3 n=1 Tax=Nyctereutes procyonoides TaxID=34880 RepID=A0A811ZQG2_NYCPR|nr:unnamed protein product [Nyctereutes procyonoides]
MAAPGAGDPLNTKSGQAPVAQRIDPTREKADPEHPDPACCIGAVVLAIYGYTSYSVSQEHFLDELEDEVKAART